MKKGEEESGAGRESAEENQRRTKRLRNNSEGSREKLRKELREKKTKGLQGRNDGVTGRCGEESDGRRR